MTWPPPSGPPHLVREPCTERGPTGAGAREHLSLLWPASSDAASRTEDRTLVVALTTLLVVDALGPGLVPDRLHAACVTVLLVVLAMHLAGRDNVRPRLTTPVLVAFLLVVAALAAGIVSGNATGPLLADLYHWSVECFLAFAVMGMLIRAVALLFTLKRVQLIGLLIAVTVLFVGRFALTARTRMLARSTIPLLGVGLLFIILPGIGRSVLPALDYSNYATITSVDVRNLQYRDAVDDLLTHPLGHGLGATIESWVPDGGRVVLEDTNYLHSSYLQAGIQVGLPLLILGVVGILVLLARVSAVPIGALRPEARWLVVFALLGVPVLMVMSLSRVATDTVWFGFLLSVLAFAPLLRDGRARPVDSEQT